MASVQSAKRRTRRLFCTSATLALALTAAPAAHAGLLGGAGDVRGLLGNPVGQVTALAGSATQLVGLGGLTMGDCQPTGLTQRFDAWNDRSWYYQVPASPLWSRSGSVSQSGSGFALGKGATVTTPAQCVGLTSATLRLVGRSADGASLRVDVLTRSGLALPAGTFRLSASSSPSPVLIGLGSVLAPLSSGFSADTRIRIAVIGGSALLQETWVDPFRRV